MITAAFTCFIAGTLLGARFRVAILLPALLVSAAAILFRGILSGQDASFIIASMIVALTTLQLGYLSTAIMTFRSARKSYLRGMTVHDSR
jgi:hypothetical protein